MTDKFVATLLAALVAGAPGLARAQATQSKPASSVNNPFLKAGIQLYNELEFGAAVEQLKKAEAQSGNSLAENVLIHMYEGIVAYDSNNRDEAETQFKIALALYPEAQLPKDISPKTQALFEKDRADIKKDAGEGNVPTIDVPRNTQGSDGTANSAANNAITQKAPEGPPGPSVAPWVALGLGVVALGAGTFFGLRAHSLGQTAQTDGFQDAASTDLNSAKVDADVAYASWGVAAAAGATFAVLYLMQDPSAPVASTTAADAH